MSYVLSGNQGTHDKLSQIHYFYMCFTVWRETIYFKHAGTFLVTSSIIKINIALNSIDIAGYREERTHVLDMIHRELEIFNTYVGLELCI